MPGSKICSINCNFPSIYVHQYHHTSNLSYVLALYIGEQHRDAAVDNHRKLNDGETQGYVEKTHTCDIS